MVTQHGRVCACRYEVKEVVGTRLHNLVRGAERTTEPSLAQLLSAAASQRPDTAAEDGTGGVRRETFTNKARFATGTGLGMANPAEDFVSG